MLMARALTSTATSLLMAASWHGSAGQHLVQVGERVGLAAGHQAVPPDAERRAGAGGEQAGGPGRGGPEPGRDAAPRRPTSCPASRRSWSDSRTSGDARTSEAPAAP